MFYCRCNTDFGWKGIPYPGSADIEWTVSLPDCSRPRNDKSPVVGGPEGCSTGDSRCTCQKVRWGIEERYLWRLCRLKGGFWRWFCPEFSASGGPWEEEWCGQKTFYHKWASPLCSLLLEGCWDSGNWHWPEANCSNRALREWAGLWGKWKCCVAQMV